MQGGNFSTPADRWPVMLVIEMTQASAPRTQPADAFGDLFSDHAPAIYNYCFRRTGDWALAEDLTSVVFMEAWRRRGSVDLVDQPVLPWLYGVATNVLRNHRRALRRHRAALLRIPDPGLTPDFAEDAAVRLDHQKQMRGLLDAIATLSEGEQEVLALCRWQGLSYADAAGALGVPVGTVRSRLARARARLADRLELDDNQ